MCQNDSKRQRFGGNPEEIEEVTQRKSWNPVILRGYVLREGILRDWKKETNPTAEISYRVCIQLTVLAYIINKASS